MVIRMWNTLGLAGQDFKKGQAQGVADALTILETVAAALRSRQGQR